MITKSSNRIILILTAFAVFLATFNETFLSVALDSIAKSFDIEFNTVQWLATSYMLGAGIMVPISAFLYRKVPTKILFMITVGCFIVGCVVAILSQSFIVLLIGRVIQAIGSGMLIPIAMNVILDVAPRQKLGSYMGVMGAMTTLGPSLSFIVAGFILTIADWKVLFYVFGVLCIICFIMATIWLGNVAKLTKPRLDIWSVVLVSIALIGILYGISMAFSDYIMAIIAGVIGIIALIFFVLRQPKIHQPLINLSPLKVKPFTLGLLLNMFTLMSLFAFNILIPQFLQVQVGTSPLTASLTMFPGIILACILSPIAGKIYDKYGVKVILPLGFAMMMVFSMLVAVFISQPSLLVLTLMYLPFNVGSALIIGPVQSYALSFLKPEQNSHGVTIFSTGFQVAGCIGVSLFAGIYSLSVAQVGASVAFIIVGALVSSVALCGLVMAVILTRMKRTLSARKPSVGRIKDIMKTEVYTINQNANILDAMKLFLDKNISGCPIVDDENKFIGFISDGDIIRFLSKNHSDFKFVYAYDVTEGRGNDFDTKLRNLMSLNIKDIASKDLFYVDIDDDLGEVCRVLAVMHKKKVPVLDNGNMIGIVTRSDITKYAMNFNVKSLS